MMQDRTAAAGGGRYTVRGFGPLGPTAGKGRITRRSGSSAAAFQLVIFCIAVAVAGVLNASLASPFAQLHALLLLLFNAVGSPATAAVGSATAQRGVSVIRHNVHVLHAVARRTSVAADLLLDLQMNAVLLWRWRGRVVSTATTHHSFHRCHSVPTGQNSRGHIEHVFQRRRPMMDIVMMMNTT
jgi:hypothetical protein